MAEGAVQDAPEEVKELVSQVGGIIGNGGAQALLAQALAKTAEPAASTPIVEPIGAVYQNGSVHLEENEPMS